MDNQQKLYTVSQLNNSVKSLLESEFALVRVEGEISNLVRATSGHWYFSLKDDKAQIKSAMFKNANQHSRVNPENGLQVIALAKVSLYAPRGDYQLIIEHLEEVGNGALQRAFELLKQKLFKAGLFAQENKKLLPEIPRCIGVITSSTGAAVHDILKVLKRRAPSIPVIIYPTLVQGDQAAGSIARMIQIANERQECDVLILGRGGGSLEDLWAFNEEIVAYAIYKSSIPIISAVGHEVDVTIADFVADVRAPTPSAAAEIVSPNREETIKKITRHLQRLQYSLVQFLKEKQQSLLFLRKRLRHPKALLQEQMQQVDELWQNLIKVQAHYFKQKNQHLAYMARNLNAVSPLATLDRGYAILRKDKQVIRDINDIGLGDLITAQIKNGSVNCLVQEKTCT